MTPEIKDIQGIEKRFDTLLDDITNDTTLDKATRILLSKYLHDGIIGKAGKKRIGKARLYRSAGIIKMMRNDWFKKDLETVNEADVERFVTALEQGKILSNRGTPYKPETKGTILKFIKKFYRYLGKPQLIGWIDTTYEKKETQALTKEEINTMLDATGDLRNKMIIQLLYDSGARIEEFLNIKYRDIQRKGEYYTLNIRVSKTKPRIVSIPMKESTVLLDRWLQENKHKKQDDFLCDVEYHAVTMMLKRLGEKAIGKNVYPHLFRHSSMTHYANLLKHYPFAKRYGLSLNSDVVNRYIDLSGVDEEETANIVKATRELELERQVRALEQRIIIMQEEINSVSEHITELLKYDIETLERARSIRLIKDAKKS